MQPDSIRVMGDKSTARETMKNAGVPTVPGSDGLLQVQFIAIFFSYGMKVFWLYFYVVNLGLSVLMFRFDFHTVCRARKKLLSLLMTLVSPL